MKPITQRYRTLLLADFVFLYLRVDCFRKYRSFPTQYYMLFSIKDITRLST